MNPNFIEVPQRTIEHFDYWWKDFFKPLSIIPSELRQDLEKCMFGIYPNESLISLANTIAIEILLNSHKTDPIIGLTYYEQLKMAHAFFMSREAYELVNNVSILINSYEEYSILFEKIDSIKPLK